MAETKNSPKLSICTQCKISLPKTIWDPAEYGIKNCETCDPSTEDIKYCYLNSRWYLIYYYATCLKCKRSFRHIACDNLGCTPDKKCFKCNLIYCCDCRPSDDMNIKFSFIWGVGWRTTAKRYVCTTCRANVFVDEPHPDSNIEFYCILCNPSDDHHRYEYSLKYKTFILCEVWSYDRQTYDHTWKVPSTMKKTQCIDCHPKKEFSKQNTYYLQEFNHDRKPVLGTFKVKTKSGRIKTAVISSDELASPVALIASIINIPHGVCVEIYAYLGNNFTQTHIENTILREAEYGQCDFSNSKFIACDLTKTNFEKTTLNYTCFDYSLLQDVTWPKFVLENVSFAGANLEKQKFSGMQLTNVNFTGANLAGTEFMGTTLQNCIFVGANLSNAKFNGHINDTNFSYANLANASFSFYYITRCCFVKTVLAATRFDNTHLCHIDFTQAYLDRTTFASTYFVHSDLSNLALNTCSFSNTIYNIACEFYLCCLNKCSFKNSELKEIHFIETSMIDANFDEAKLWVVEFSHCNLQNASFALTCFNQSFIYPCIISECNITHTHFKQSNFANLKLVSTLISTADIEDCQFGKVTLEKCITADEKEKYAHCIIVNFIT